MSHTEWAAGRHRGAGEVAPAVDVAPLQPALASITVACRYLGGISRSRLYELMPELDVVRLGARTFIALESLNRLIAANTRLATRGSNAARNAG
jgi:hypothetical protein